LIAYRHPYVSVFRKIFFQTLGLLILVLTWPEQLSAQKTDRVLLQNGDGLVGEIKRMNESLLEFSQDDILGRIYIKWEHVLGLVSAKKLDVELRDGTYYLGSLIPSPVERELRIQTDSVVIEVNILDVSFIKPIRERFWKNLDGSVSTGISFAKSTDLIQFSLGFEVSYRSLKTLNTLKLNTLISGQKGQASKTNTDLDFVHLFFLKSRWYLQGSLGGTRNDELGIDLRSSLALGGGRRLVRKPRMQLLLSGLMSGNIENRNDGTEIQNLESVISLTFIVHKYDTPRIEFSTNASGFFSLSSLGRVRVNTDSRLSLEIVKDLFWDISQFYFRFDSDPSLAASSRTDFGFVTNIRYRFGRGISQGR
jgi:hypothetical protein